MNNIAIPQKVLIFRNGIEISLNQDIAERIEADWIAGLKAPIGIAGRTMNTVDLTGVVFPHDIDARNKRKAGQWQCLGRAKWHEKGEKCDCISNEDEIKIAKREQAIRNCGKCTNGYLIFDDVARPCECLTGLTQA